MMGHKNIQTTRRYARVNNEKIGNDMKLLSLRISDKYTYVMSLPPDRNWQKSFFYGFHLHIPSGYTNFTDARKTGAFLISL